MADVVDDFGRVTRLKADFESLSESLRSAVGKAVEYAAGRAQENTDSLKEEFDKLVEAMEELGDDVKENLKSTKEFVEEVKRAVDSMEKIKVQKNSADVNSFADAQRDQTKILHHILAAHQKATRDKTAKFTTGGTVLSAPSPRKTALKEMGFRPRGADKIPAMVSPGEFVVSKKGTMGNEGLLDRINRGYVRGGEVKPAYLAGGTGGSFGGRNFRIESSGGVAHIIVEGKWSEETERRLKEEFAHLGQEISVDFAEKFDNEFKKRFSTWAASIATAITGGGDPWQIMFEGAVKDVTEFRREMRNLAFQTEGITGNFREAQAEFAKIGKDIAGRTGVSVTAFNKAYMNNAKKGFKDQKAGMKVLEAGLELSTLIGSEAQATASMFADWHRELGLSSFQMEKMSRDMRSVALSTGVAGDELLNAMKSSDGILKNLRNQGNLTSNVAKSVVTMMAEAQKTGYTESTNKVLTALSSHSGMMGADDKTKGLLYSVANRMGGQAPREMLAGNFMRKRENLAGFATNMKDLVANLIQKRGVDFDFAKLTEGERELLAIRLQGLGMEIGEAENLISTTEKASKGLRGTMDELDAMANNQFATDADKALAEKKRNDALLGASMDFLSGIRDKTGKQSLADAMVQLEGSKEFSDQRQDFTAMASALTPSMMRQFNLSGNGDQVAQQMAAMDVQKQAELSSLIAADQLMKAAKEQGRTVKDFGPEMQAALAKGDTKKFNELRDEMQGELSKIGVEDATGVDPIEKLEQTMNKLNETIRNSFSPLTGAILDFIGAFGLMGIQIGMMGSTLSSLIGGPVRWLAGGGMGKFLMDGALGPFFKGFTREMKKTRDIFGAVGRGIRGQIRSSEALTKTFAPFLKGFDRAKAGGSSGGAALLRGVSGQFASFIHGPMGKIFQKALGPAVLILGGIKGAMEASEAGRTKTEGALLGTLTGGAQTGSFLTGRYGDQAGAVDKTLGVAGAAAWGASAGAAISLSLGGLDLGASILIGAIIGGVSEIVKIITEGTDILADLFAPFQAIGNWLSGILGDLWRILKSFATLNPVTIVTEVVAGIVGIISKTVYAFFAVIFGAIRMFVIGLPRLILRAFEMLWELPRMFMESIKNALAGLANNEWLGPIFKTLSVAFDAIYDGFMAIWTPISQIFSGLGTVFSDLGKALFGSAVGGSILSGIMWALKQAVWGLSYVISWLLSPVILLAKALGFVLKIIGKVIGGIVGAFQYLYNILVGNSIVPDLVFGIIKFFAMLPIRIFKFLAMIPIHLAKALLNLHVIIGSAIMSIGSAIMAGFKAVFVDLPNYLWSGLTSLASSDWFGPIFEPLIWVLSPLKDAMSALYDSFAEVGSVFVEVGSVFGELYGVISEVLDSLYDAVSSVFGTLYDAVSSVFSSIYAVFSPLTSIFGGTGEAASKAFGFMDVLKGAMWGLSKAIGFVLKVALFPLKIILEGLAFVIKAVANVVKGFADIIAGVFTLDGTRIWEGMSGIGKAIGSVFLWIPKMLFKMFKKIPKMFLRGLKAVFYDFPSWLMGKLMDGVWAVGNFLVLTLPKIIWQAFKNSLASVGKFVWDTLSWPFKKLGEMLQAVFYDLPIWLGTTIMEGLQAVFYDLPMWLGKTIWDGMASIAAGIPGALYGALHSAASAIGLGWLVDKLSGGTASAAGSASKGFSEMAEQQEATRLAEGDKISHAIGGLAGAVGSLTKGNLSEAGGKAWSATKETVGAAWEGTKYVASYLNPFSYFKEGTKKIEKPGLGMLHEGEMVVPRGIVDKIAAVGDGAFGSLSSFFGGKKEDGGGGPISSLLSFIRGKMGGGGGEDAGGSILSSLSDRIKGMGDVFKGCCPGGGGDVQVHGVSEAVADALKGVDEGSFFGRIKKKFEDAQGYTDSFFKPLTLGFNRARKNGDGFFASITKGLKYQFMSMSHGNEGGVMSRLAGSMDWLSKSMFGESEGKDTKRSILQRLKDGIFGSKEGEETKRGILDVIKKGLFGEGGEGMKKGMFDIMKEGFFGKEDEGGGLMGWFKSKVFGHKVGEGEEGPSKPGLADVAKGTAESLWEGTKRTLEINTEDGVINGTKKAAQKIYGKAKDTILGEKLAEGEMGPARPGLLTKAKSKAGDLYGKAKDTILGEKLAEGEMGPARPGLLTKAKSKAGDLYGKAKDTILGKSPSEALESAASADSKVPGKLESFKEKMKNVAGGVKEFSGTKVLAGAANLIPSSVGLVAMAPGSLGVRMLASIDGKAIQSSIEGLAKGVSALGEGKVLLGAAAMLAVGVASIGLIPAIPVLAVLGMVGPLVQGGLKALGKGLSIFGKAAANPYTWLGVLLLGALNVVMIPLAYAISLLSPAIEAFGKAIKMAFEGAGSMLKAVGESIGMILKEITISKALALGVAAVGITALGAAMVAFSAGKFISAWIDYFAGDGVFTKLIKFAEMASSLMIAATAVDMLGKAMKTFASSTGGGWADWLSGSDGVVESLKELSKIGTPEFIVAASAVHKMGEGMEKIHSVPIIRPLSGDATTATTPVGEANPVAASLGMAEVEPVHLRDITGTILRDRAGSEGNRLQSDELTRMEEASNRQVSELEQIRQGIQELVSLMRPSGRVVGSGDDAGATRTKDPRRPMHAAAFGKMKYGKMGGSPNRSLVNNGEV